MATSRRTAKPVGIILGLPQTSAIAAPTDPKESGTALAQANDKFVSEFKPFEHGADLHWDRPSHCDKMATQKNENEQNGGKIVGESLLHLVPGVPRNGHDAVQ